MDDRINNYYFHHHCTLDNYYHNSCIFYLIDLCKINKLGNCLRINFIKMFFQVNCITILDNFQMLHMWKIILKNSNSISSLYNYIMKILSMFDNQLNMDYKFKNCYNILMGNYLCIISELLKALYHLNNF